MAERRRIIPNSVGQDFFHRKEKHYKPTRRFILTLNESNDKSSPSFSFTQLSFDAGDIQEDEINGKNFNDLEEDDLTGLAKLAKKFEEKYGPQKGNKRRKKLEELIDVGLGYDETDPFVDNTECYDELVPMELTTQFGGFYINSGELSFKELSEDSEDSDFEIFRRKKKGPKKKKKKILDSDDEKVHKKQKKRHLSGNDTPRKKIKKKLSKQFGMEEKKKKKKKLNLGKTPTVAELLKSKTHGPSDQPKQLPSSQNTNHSLTNGISESSKKEQVPMAPSVTASSDHFDPTLGLDLGLPGVNDLQMDSEMAAFVNETLAGMGDEDVDMDMLSVSPGEVDMLSTSPAPSSAVSPSQSGMEVNTGSTPEGFNLPPNLSEDLLRHIAKIKEAAVKSAEGKCKFFSPNVNHLLLQIENSSRSLPCGKRQAIYNHLAHHLPCTKETLLKRAKKLRLGAQDSRLKEPIQKLKEAISQVMPAQIERHTEECAEAERTKQIGKLPNETAEKEEKNPPSQDEDDEKSQGPKVVMPRRKFQWNDHLRKLLCDVVLIKIQTFEMSKTRSSAEVYLKTFLENDLKPLWPYGWMQTRMLFKESRSVHSKLTSMPPKPKKLIPAPPKKPSVKKQDGSQSICQSLNGGISLGDSVPSSSNTTPESKPGGSQKVSPYSSDSMSSKNDTSPKLENNIKTVLDYASQDYNAQNGANDNKFAIPGETLSLLQSAMSEVEKNLSETRSLQGASGTGAPPSGSYVTGSTTLPMETIHSSKPFVVKKSPQLSPSKLLHSSFSIENISQSSSTSGHADQSNTSTSSRIIKIPSSKNDNQKPYNMAGSYSSNNFNQLDKTQQNLNPSMQPVIKLTRAPNLEKFAGNLKGSSNVRTLPSPVGTSGSVQGWPTGSMKRKENNVQHHGSSTSSQNSRGDDRNSSRISPHSVHGSMGMHGLNRQSMPMGNSSPSKSHISPRTSPSHHAPSSRVSPIGVSRASPIGVSRASPIGMVAHSNAPTLKSVNAGGMPSMQMGNSVSPHFVQPPILSPQGHPEGMHLPASLPRRGSYPGPYPQVVTPPLTSPGGSIMDQRRLSNLQQMSPTRKVGPLPGMAQVFKSMQAQNLMGQGSHLGQVPHLGQRSPEADIPGMFLPSSVRDPGYNSDSSQGQPRIH